MSKFRILLIGGIFGLVLYFLMDYAIPLAEFCGIYLTRSQRAEIVQDTLIGQLGLALIFAVIGSILSFAFKNGALTSTQRVVCVVIYLIPAANMACLAALMLFSALH